MAPQFFLVFLEGVGSFVSPCMLPMLPIYIAYFSAGAGKGRGVRNALGFVLGFSAVFMAMGAAAGSMGGLLARHHTALTRVAGALMVLLGLGLTGLVPSLPARWLRGPRVSPSLVRNMDFASALLFGVLFAVGWTPCIGVFLSAALLMAAGTGSTLTGVAMLLCYSLGLGIPFVMAALLLERLGGALAFMKRHMAAVGVVSGAVVMLAGVAMLSGWMDRLLTVLLPKG